MVASLSWSQLKQVWSLAEARLSLAQLSPSLFNDFSGMLDPNCVLLNFFGGVSHPQIVLQVSWCLMLATQWILMFLEAHLNWNFFKGHQQVLSYNGGPNEKYITTLRLMFIVLNVLVTWWYLIMLTYSGYLLLVHCEARKGIQI